LLFPVLLEICLGLQFEPPQVSFLSRNKRLSWGSKPYVSAAVRSRLVWGAGDLSHQTVSWAQGEGRGFADVKGFKWNESCS